MNEPTLLQAAKNVVALSGWFQRRPDRPNDKQFCTSAFAVEVLKAAIAREENPQFDLTREIAADLNAQATGAPEIDYVVDGVIVRGRSYLAARNKLLEARSLDLRQGTHWHEEQLTGGEPPPCGWSDYVVHGKTIRAQSFGAAIEIEWRTRTRLAPEPLPPGL